MDFSDFTAGSNDEGRRLDRILKIILKNKPPSAIMMALRKKYILLNGSKAEGKIHVKKGDRISVATFLLKAEVPQTEPKRAANEQKNTLSISENQILFKNEHILIINKRRGDLVQKAKRSDKSLAEANLFANEIGGQKNPSISFTPAPLHRLDKQTTGALAFSLSLAGATWFSKALQNHSITKIYVGIAEGRIDHSLDLKNTIIIEENANVFKTVTVKTSESPNAFTLVRPLAVGTFNGKAITLCQFNIQSGKKHQIRAQCAFSSHPLLGDTAYGGLNIGRPFFLHAALLGFPQNNPLNLPSFVRAPLPSDFADFLNFCLINWNGDLIM